MQAVKQANAQSEAKAQASGAQSANASYGTEFATETDVHAVKNKMHNQKQRKHKLLVHKVQTLVMVLNLQLKQTCML